MLQITKKLTRRFVLAIAMIAAGGFALGSAADANAYGCGGYGGGYGYGGYGGFGARPVVVARPVVAVPHRGYGYGYGRGYNRGINRGGGFYGAGYRGGGGFYGGRGVSIGFGF